MIITVFILPRIALFKVGLIDVDPDMHARGLALFLYYLPLFLILCTQRAELRARMAASAMLTAIEQAYSSTIELHYYIF